MNRAEILADLQRQILPLQGMRAPKPGHPVHMGWGDLDNAFSHHSFPTGAVHEFLYKGQEESASTVGFIGGILAGLMRHNGVCIWISCKRTLFPPALKYFGITPDRIIFIDVEKHQDALWVMEEALGCDVLSAVIGEITDLNFTESRRLQLAVEKTGVTGFILRKNIQRLNTTACVSRWQITSLPCSMEDDLPGVGLPRWNVELQKIRNGKPGTWQLEWAGSCFRHVTTPAPSVFHVNQKKAG